jgi:hypothetical protein
LGLSQSPGSLVIQAPVSLGEYHWFSLSDTTGNNEEICVYIKYLILSTFFTCYTFVYICITFVMYTEMYNISVTVMRLILSFFFSFLIPNSLWWLKEPFIFIEWYNSQFLSSLSSVVLSQMGSCSFH